MTRRFTALGASLLLLGAGAGCAAPRPSELPADEPWIVAVKSARLPFDRWYSAFAHHSWIDVKHGGPDAWRRIEIRSRRSGVGITPIGDDEARGDVWHERRPVHLLGAITGEAARRVAQRIEEAAVARAELYRDGYRLWPGPNSNTFVADLVREFGELSCVFDPNAIGKDYPGWIDAGATASKTGLRVDTPIVGAALALQEGVELHLFGLTLGVCAWPPGISLPFLPRLPGGLLRGGEPGVPPPPPPHRLTARVDLDLRAAATPDGPVEHGLDGLPLRGRVVLVDAESGEWAHASWRFERGAPPAPPWSLEVSARSRGLRLDRDLQVAGPLDEARGMDVAVETGELRIALRFTLTAEESARLDVRARRRRAPDPTGS